MIRHQNLRQRRTASIYEGREETVEPLSYEAQARNAEMEEFIKLISLLKWRMNRISQELRCLAVLCLIIILIKLFT